ncbi:hypothetical protein C8R43DRAFT_883950 [Mycena crocata]|nr:hypothetical protein C8R43DRAFT_883950 [Mycena crocata]
MILDTHKWPAHFLAVRSITAREHLLRFTSMGRKVANCVLLTSKVEIVPVDTHVHQITTGHYSFKVSLTAKANMTPKLYEEINTRFFWISGQYTGWATSYESRCQ